MIALRRELLKAAVRPLAIQRWAGYCLKALKAAEKVCHADKKCSAKPVVAASRDRLLSVGERLQGTSQCTDLPEDLPEIKISKKAKKIGVFAVFLLGPV